MGAFVPPLEEGKGPLVIFTLDDQRYALRLDAVERVVGMVAIAPLPALPRAVLGVVNVAGEVLPVYDIRSRFGLSGREADPSDQLILAHTRKRRIALAVDRVLEVAARADSAVVEAESILPDLKYVAGVVKQPDGLVFIHDLESFLSAEEDDVLDGALAQL